MPAYLKSLKYQNPDQPENTLSHYATGTDFFAYLRDDPVRLVRFNSAMKGAGGILASPIPPRLLDAAKKTAGEDGVVMVDIGGGIGQVTEKTMEASPNAKGRFIVQDLGKIIDEARAKRPKYEVMEYDFFTEQQIKGTYLRIPTVNSQLLCHASSFADVFPDTQALASISYVAFSTTSRTANAAKSSRIKSAR
jgi:hypothetical protein